MLDAYLFAIMSTRNNILAPSLKFFGVGLYCCDVLQSHRNSLKCQNQGKNKDKLKAGAHQMEPPSPIQALGVNPFPEETSRADSGKGQSQRRNDIAIVLHHTAGNTVLTGQTQSYNSET